MCFTVVPSVVFILCFFVFFHEHFSRRFANKSFHVCKCFSPFYILLSLFFFTLFHLIFHAKNYIWTMEYTAKKVSICEDNVNTLHCKTFSLKKKKKKCKTDRWSLTLSTLSLLLYILILIVQSLLFYIFYW